MPQPAVVEEWTSRLPGLERLWSLSKGRPEVRIAVLDGPVDTASAGGAHVAPSGILEHGTLVQSIISGSSDAVVPGVAPGCTVLSIPIFEPASARDPPTCTQADLAKAIRKAVDAHANVINISAAQQADALSLTTELSGALQDALGRDVLVVAAAGNQGCACDTIPASVAGVLAVGAHDNNGAPLVSSNWGPNQRTQGIIAPGSDVPGVCVGGGLCRASGTSFAAATVSGVAGLLMSADLERKIAPSGRRIRSILLDSSVRPRPGEVEMAATHLAGRLDVSRAVERLLATSAPSRAGEETLKASSLPDNGGHRHELPSSSSRRSRARKADRAEAEPAEDAGGGESRLPAAWTFRAAVLRGGRGGIPLLQHAMLAPASNVRRQQKES